MQESTGLIKTNAQVPSVRKGDAAFSPAAITDAGCERELNEDRYAVIESTAGLLWLVCDGMGGVKGGELAAQLAIDSVKRYLDNHEISVPQDAVSRAVSEANRIIVLRRQNQAFAQMGTTLVGAIFSGHSVSLVNVGDSRAYLVGPEGNIQQLTEDDTYVQQLVRSKKIAPEEALSHPQAHVLTKALGAETNLEISVSDFWIWDTGSDSSAQDYIMLCTDGLYSLVTDSEIGEIVSSNTPQAACAELTRLARERGGYDNITVAVVPLLGRLRTEPPPGYIPPRKTVRSNVMRRSPQEIKFAFLKYFFMISGLTLISLMLVFLIILKQISE